jgi:hypothetical protein
MVMPLRELKGSRAGRTNSGKLDTPGNGRGGCGRSVGLDQFEDFGAGSNIAGTTAIADTSLLDTFAR